MFLFFCGDGWLDCACVDFVVGWWWWWWFEAGCAAAWSSCFCFFVEEVGVLLVLVLGARTGQDSEEENDPSGRIFSIALMMKMAKDELT